MVPVSVRTEEQRGTFGNRVSAMIVELPTNEFDPIAGTLEVRPQGKKNVLAREPNIKLEGGKSYTFVVAGTLAKVDIIKIEDDVAKNVSSN